MEPKSFQTEGTDVYDFDSYVKVHTVDTEMSIKEHATSDLES